MKRSIFKASLLLSASVLLQLIFPANALASFNYEDVTQKIHYKDPYIAYSSDNPLFYETKALGKDKDIRIYIFADLNERFTQKFFNEIFPQFFTKVGDKVIFIYRHHLFTNDFKNSMKSAIFSECVAAQGEFWPHIPRIIKNTNSLSIKILDQNIDTNKFKNCTNDPNTIFAIKSQSEFADQSGFIGIPTFIVENAKDESALAIKIDGVHDASYYERAVNEIIQEEQKNQEAQKSKEEIEMLQKKLEHTQRPWFLKFFDSVKTFFTELFH